jgi:hypothetical protein
MLQSAGKTYCGAYRHLTATRVGANFEQERVFLGRLLLEAGASPLTVSTIDYYTALESVCSSRTDYPETVLQPLHAMAGVGPYCFSSAHASGKPLLEGVWSDWIGLEIAEGLPYLHHYANLAHLISVSDVILRSCPEPTLKVNQPNV